MEVFCFCESFNEVIHKQLLPTLRNKSTKKKEENGVVAQRTSKFVQNEI